MEEKFAIAFGAGDGGVDDVEVAATEFGGAGADAIDGQLVRGGVADDAAFADALAAGFELGLDEKHCVYGGPFRERCEDRRKHEGRGDKGHVHRKEGNTRRQVAGVKKAGVGALHEGHAGIVAERLGDLAVAGIDGEDAGGAVLEHAVGEAAGGGTGIQTKAAGEVDVPVVKGGFELESAATDVAQIGAEEANGDIVGDGVTRLVGLLFVDEDAAGEDEGLSAFACRDESAFDEKFVQTGFHGWIFIDEWRSPSSTGDTGRDEVASQRECKPGTIPAYCAMTEETTQAKRGWAMTWLGWALAVVFALTAAVLAHHVAYLRGELNTSQGGAAQMKVQLDHANQVVAVLSSPQSAHVLLSETRQPLRPVGQVSWLASQGALVFVAGGLRDLPPEKAYELWLIPRGGKAPIPAGLFRPDPDHGATVVLPPLPAETEAQRFLVTVEPGRGSETPSLPIVIQGESR